MASVRISRLLLFALLGPWLICVQTETVVSPAPTMRVNNPEAASGGGASDITTKDPFYDHTELVFTHSQTLDQDFGTLGPGALSTIVIAVFLGASVLLALLVITLRRARLVRRRAAPNTDPPNVAMTMATVADEPHGLCRLQH